MTCIDVPNFFYEQGFSKPEPKCPNGIPLTLYKHVDLLLRLEFVKNAPTGIDIIEVLEVAKHYFEQTRRCQGLLMFQHIKTRQPIGDGFDFIRDVKNATHMYCVMLTERTGTKYKNVLKHIVNPLLETFRYMSHSEALDTYASRFDAVIQFIRLSQSDYDETDAKVAYKMLTNYTKNRASARQAAEYIHEKRTKVKK